jgi:hypothetical protein
MVEQPNFCHRFEINEVRNVGKTELWILELCKLDFKNLTLSQSLLHLTLNLNTFCCVRRHIATFSSKCKQPPIIITSSA